MTGTVTLILLFHYAMRWFILTLQMPTYMTVYVYIYVRRRIWMELFKESLTDLIPSPSNMYNTSSVATLPLAPLAYGHPPRPAVELSTTDTPICMQAQNTVMSVIILLFNTELSHPFSEQGPGVKLSTFWGNLKRFTTF